MYFDREKEYWFFSYFIHEKSLKKRFVRLLKALSGVFYNYTIMNKEEKSVNGLPKDYLFVLANRREDYHNLFKSIFNACDQNKIWIEVGLKSGINILLLKNIVSKLRLLHTCKSLHIEYYEKDRKKSYDVQLGILQTLSMYFYIIRGKTIAEYVFRENEAYANNLVVLNDFSPYEPMIIEKATELGMNTVCGQHGMSIPDFCFENMGTYNLLNLICDEYLVWGQKTKKIMEMHNNKNIKYHVCGNPTLRNINLQSNSTILGIVLDVNYHQLHNQRMIDIVTLFAKQNNYKVSIRIHPSDNEKSYQIDKSVASFDKNVDDAYVIIAHTSTMIFSFLKQGKRVVRYKSEMAFFEYPFELEFDTLESISSAFNYCIRQSDNIWTLLGNEYIIAIDAEASEKYKAAFDSIMKCSE